MTDFFPRYRFLFALLVPLFFISCSATRKATEKHSPGDLPAVPVSEIDIPIQIAAAPLLAKGEQVVPTIFTSDAWPNFTQPSCDFKYKYRFVRSALHLSCSNNTIGVRFSGSYQVAGSRCLCTAGLPVTPWISGSCGFVPQPMRNVNITLRSGLKFLPSYQVQTQTAVDLIQAADRCQVSVFSSDITQLVVDSIRSSLLGFITSMDFTISSLRFDKSLQKLKDSSYRKISIGKYGYLLIDPSAIRIGQLNFARDSFSISAGMSFHPKIGSDPTMPDGGTKTFPPLQQQEGGRGIRIFLDAVYDYAFISKLLYDSLHNRVFDVKGRTIVIKDISLKGLENDHLELKVDFAGSNHGSIYVRGTPQLDTARQTLTLQNLSYSLEGADLALKLARSLFRSKIRKTIEGNSYLDVGALVKSNLPAIDHLLNKELTKGVFSSGKTQDIRITGMKVSAGNIHFQLLLAAQLSILCNGIF
jgi:Domain of unknown function (DUF4403)